MKNVLDLTIDNQRLEYSKMSKLYWKDMFSNHELNYPDEVYIKFFQENVKYFTKDDSYEECDCNNQITDKLVFNLECYESDDCEFVCKEDKVKIKQYLNEDNKYLIRTCSFFIIVCPLCGEWYGYYVNGSPFWYDEEFGVDWK